MGSYVNSNLIKDEKVEYETSYHWIIFLNPFKIFILALIDKLTSEFVITNKRVIIKVGIISRRTVEMNHSKIESVGVNQSILGRILGFGTVILVGSGGTKEIFHTIKKPLVFRKRFQELSS